MRGAGSGPPSARPDLERPAVAPRRVRGHVVRLRGSPSQRSPRSANCATQRRYVAVYEADVDVQHYVATATKHPLREWKVPGVPRVPPNGENP